METKARSKLWHNLVIKQFLSCRKKIGGTIFKYLMDALLAFKDYILDII